MKFTQKELLRYFRDNNISEIEAFISYVGDYRKNGRKTISTLFTVIKPQKIIIKESIFGKILFDDIDDENNSRTSALFRFDINCNNNPLYPNDGSIVNNFDMHSDILDTNNNKFDFDGDLINRIFFFNTLEEAEIHFVKLLNNYLKEKELLDAIELRDNILKKVSKENPEKILELI